MTAKRDPIVVLPLPEDDAANEARAQLVACSEVFLERSLEAHAEGIRQHEISVRMKLAAEIFSDAVVLELRERLLEEGLLELLPLTNAPAGPAVN